MKNGYSGIVSFIILKLIGVVMPLRATREDEATGLDITQHGEEAYLHTGGMEAVMLSKDTPSHSMSTSTVSAR